MTSKLGDTEPWKPLAYGFAGSVQELCFGSSGLEHPSRKWDFIFFFYGTNCFCDLSTSLVNKAVLYSNFSVLSVTDILLENKKSVGKFCLIFGQCWFCLQQLCKPRVMEE